MNKSIWVVEFQIKGDNWALTVDRPFESEKLARFCADRHNETSSLKYRAVEYTRKEPA